MKKYLISFFFVLSLVFFLSEDIFSRPRFDKRISWSEEFIKDGMPSDEIWTIEKKLCKTELQNYVKSKANSFCENGILHIKCIKEESKDRHCTSARLNTKGKKSFLYGKIEVKAKAPIGKGIFPAIWMLPEDMSKPYGEIDFMEYIDCWKGEKIQSNVHVVFEYGKNQNQYQKKVNLKVDEWHIYALEWYKDKLVFVIDGKIVHQVKKENLKAWPFDRPYYLFLNVAFGGWGGTCDVDYDILPQEMLVDYVRYYKLKE